MTDDMPDGAAAPVPPAPQSFVRRNWGKITLATLVLTPVLVFTIWAGVALSFTYSDGTRGGFVQKLSRKGWLCKTWEGEMAQVNMPGAVSQIFTFTVRSDSLANEINKLDGARVEVYYEQHVGVPSSCFGETEYFVKSVKASRAGG